MSNLILFLVEISLCLCISIAVIHLLKPYLRDVLTEICGTENRAAFWVMFTQLMFVISPLLLVIFFIDAKPGINTYPVEAIKDSLFRALLGLFLAISMIGRVIWKSFSMDHEETVLPEHTEYHLKAE